MKLLSKLQHVGRALLDRLRPGRSSTNRKGTSSMPGFVKLATLEELPPGSAKEVEHDGRIYALFNVKGRITAIDGLCPHQGGPLADGHLEGDCVSCPWHGWEFDVSTGKSSMGPAMKQPVFNVKVEGSEILVEIP